MMSRDLKLAYNNTIVVYEKTLQTRENISEWALSSRLMHEKNQNNLKMKRNCRNC